MRCAYGHASGKPPHTSAFDPVCATQQVRMHRMLACVRGRRLRHEEWVMIVMTAWVINGTYNNSSDKIKSTGAGCTLGPGQASDCQRQLTKAPPRGGRGEGDHLMSVPAAAKSGRRTCKHCIASQWVHPPHTHCWPMPTALGQPARARKPISPTNTKRPTARSKPALYLCLHALVNIILNIWCSWCVSVSVSYLA